MKRFIFVVSILFMVNASVEAGHRKNKPKPTPLQKFAFRQQKLDSGVTLTRARTQMYRAQTAANVTGIFSPLGIIANILGR